MVDAIVNNPVHNIKAQCELDEVGSYDATRNPLSEMANRLINMFELGMIQYNDRFGRMELTTYGKSYFIRKYETITEEFKTGSCNLAEIEKAFSHNNKTTSTRNMSKKFELANCMINNTPEPMNDNYFNISSEVENVEDCCDHSLVQQEKENLKLIPKFGKKAPNEDCVD